MNTIELRALKEKQFTGILRIKSDRTQIEWQIYFCLGKIIWAQKDRPSELSLKKAISQNVPKLKFKLNSIVRAKKYRCWHYYFVSYLLENRLINGEKFELIITTLVREVISDILNHQNTEILKYSPQNTSVNYLLESGLKIYCYPIDTDNILQKLDNKLEIQQRLFKTTQIAKLSISRVSTDSFYEENTSQPLIACIDDSSQTLKIMEQIIIGQGYRFIGIQESLQVIPTLIKSQPDLIFLDLGMPVLNGYEIFQQLRRVSKFENIPIIMLTGQNTVIDRLKAKIVGISDFLTKPIANTQVINTIASFLEDGKNLNLETKKNEPGNLDYFPSSFTLKMQTTSF